MWHSKMINLDVNNLMLEPQTVTRANLQLLMSHLSLNCCLRYVAGMLLGPQRMLDDDVCAARRDFFFLSFTTTVGHCPPEMIFCITAVLMRA